MTRFLIPHNKRNRETTSEQCLTLLKHNPKEFLRRFVSVDETWIHWYTPDTKEQSKQWTSPGERAPKKVMTVLSAGKADGMLHICNFLNLIGDMTSDVIDVPAKY